MQGRMLGRQGWGPMGFALGKTAGGAVGAAVLRPCPHYTLRPPLGSMSSLSSMSWLWTLLSTPQDKLCVQVPGRCWDGDGGASRGPLSPSHLHHPLGARGRGCQWVAGQGNLSGDSSGAAVGGGREREDHMGGWEWGRTSTTHKPRPGPGRQLPRAPFLAAQSCPCLARGPRWPAWRRDSAPFSSCPFPAALRGHLLDTPGGPKQQFPYPCSLTPLDLEWGGRG